MKHIIELAKRSGGTVGKQFAKVIEAAANSIKPQRPPTNPPTAPPEQRQ
jgi:hypothetical protein